MNTQTFFSIIIPTHNRKPFLKKAVDSVLAQTYPEYELIIIDDGSSDGTKELISSYSDKRIIYHYQDNKGVSKARNKGLSLARYDLIAFLDSDDWWLPEKLEKTLSAVEDHPAINIFHTEETWYRNGRLLNQKNKHKKPSGIVYKNALPICCISISTVAIKKEVFDTVGNFDENFEACEDYDFWLRATSKYKVHLIPEYLTEKDGGRPDQLSSKVWGLDRFRIKALCKILDSGTLTTEQNAATLNELQKKCGIFALGCEKRGKTENAEHYRQLAKSYA